MDSFLYFSLCINGLNDGMVVVVVVVVGGVIAVIVLVGVLVSGL